MPTRRDIIGRLGFCAGAALTTGIACAERRAPAGACPTIAGQRIRWVVPNAPGGGYDTEARVLQPFLERRLGATIVIENQPGAGGLIGARAIVEARPDGRTIGNLGLPGLTMARLLGHEAAPDPAADFTILGRVSRSVHVWAAGARSPLRTIGDAVAGARLRPLVFPLNEIGSVDFLSITVPAALLDAPIEIVPGFEGTRAIGLAAIRGDVDLVAGNYESLRSMFEAGELRPILQVSGAPIAEAAVLDGVALLGGAEGEAARAAEAVRRDRGWAVDTAAALVRVIGSGRVVVGPRGLPDDVAECLSGVLGDVLGSEELRRVTPVALDSAPAAVVRDDALAASDDAARLLPLLQPMLNKLGG
jgi:tripartite-type tricarboxylate transporter receptor subunit TctC